MKLMNFKHFSLNENTDDNYLSGGITFEDYNNIIDTINQLKQKMEKGTLTDDEKIFSEILNKIIKRNYFDVAEYRLNRMKFIKKYNKTQRKHGIETNEFRELVWWLQDLYEWNFVEPEGCSRVRFEWNDGTNIMWLNDDMSIDGYPPEEIKKSIEEKQIKINN